MRKLFRMKYESCTGRCYDHSDVMRIHTLGLDMKNAVEFLKRLVAIHEPSCGNNQIQFRLDADEWQETEGALGMGGVEPTTQKTRFVASFYHYGALDLFSGATPLEAMNKMIDAALRWYQSDEGFGLLKEQPGKGHSVCEHGDDKKLIEFAISFSGLCKQDQDELRAQFA